MINLLVTTNRKEGLAEGRYISKWINALSKGERFSSYLHWRLGIVVIVQEGRQALNNGVGTGDLWRTSTFGDRRFAHDFDIFCWARGLLRLSSWLIHWIYNEIWCTISTKTHKINTAVFAVTATSSFISKLTVLTSYKVSNVSSYWHFNLQNNHHNVFHSTIMLLDRQTQLSAIGICT